MKTIIYYIGVAIHLYPPCVSEVFALKDTGINVVVFTDDCDENLLKTFKERDISVYLLKYRHSRNRLENKVWRVMRLLWMSFLIREIYRNNVCALWIGFEGHLKRDHIFLGKFHPVIINILEFYETESYQKLMRKIAQKADIVTACEAHRAQYMMDWWHLNRLPYVLPNKPYGHPRIKYLPGSTRETREAIKKIRGRKILLFQGSRDAAVLLPLLAKAIISYGLDYSLVLTGNIGEKIISEVEQIDPDITYLGFFPAPSHLEITSYASIGIAAYDDNSINTRYCAPNKIYEYTGFGIPVLCNLVPGLTETIGKAQAGICVDFNRPLDIRNAILEIEKNYDFYSNNAERFFDATDNMPVIKEIIEDAFSRTDGMNKKQKDGQYK